MMNGFHFQHHYLEKSKIETSTREIYMPMTNLLKTFRNWNWNYSHKRKNKCMLYPDNKIPNIFEPNMF